MATVATAEVEIIADTRRFVGDLRRKLRAALTGIGDDVGRDLAKELRGVGQQIGKQLEREVNDRVIPQFNQAMERAGRESARKLTNVFDDEFDLEEVTVRKAIRAADAMDQAFEARFARNFDKYERTFESEFDLEQAAVRKAISAADAMDQAFEARFARNFSRYEATFESEFDLEQAAFRKAVSAANAMDQAFEQQFAQNFERRGEQAAQALADGIENQRNRVTNAFSNIINGIEARQRVQLAAAQAAEDAADAFANRFDTSLRGRLRLTLRGLSNFGDVFDGLRPFAERASGVLRGFGTALTNIGRAITITPLENLGNLFSDVTEEMASGAAIGLLLLGVIDQLSGALFALPAAFGVLSAAVATVLVGFHGMIEAFDKGGESLAGLAPAAQSVAREWLALKDDFRLLKLDAQEALWSELDGAITSVADNLMGPLREGITQSSGALGILIRGFTDFLAETETAETVAAIFDALTVIFQSLGDEVQPFLRGMRTLSNEFLPALEDIERVLDGIGGAFERWATAVTTGDLLSGISPAQRAFQEALQTVEQLWRIAVNVADAVESILTAARRSGHGFLDLIERISGRVAEAFSSPEGQDTLKSFLDDLNDISETVLEVLGTVFKQFPKIADPISDIAQDIGPDLKEFIEEIGDAFAVFLEEAGPGFKELASALGDLDLQDIANNLGDAFSNVAPFLNEIIDMFGDVVEIISIIVRTMSFVPRTIAKFARGFVFLQEVFDNIRNVDGILAGIGEFFADFGPRVADGFDDAVGEAEEFFSTFGARVSDGFSDFLDDTGEFFSEFGSRVADGFDDTVEDIAAVGERIGRGAEEIFSPFVDGLVELGGVIGDFFTDTLPAAVESGFSSMFEFFVTKWEEIKQGWSDFWEGLGVETSSFFTNIGTEVSTGLDGLVTTVTTWTTGVTEMWGTFWTGLKDRALLALQGIGLDVTGSLGGVRSTFSGWQTGIAEGWNNFWSGLASRVRSGLDSIRSTVSNVLSSIRSTVSGWIANIRSAWNTFWSGLSSFASSQLSAISSRVSGALNSLRGAFSSFISNVRSAWQGLIGFLQNIASTIQNIVSRISGAISSAISAAQNLGNIDLNPFADGGIVTRATPALIGEAGPEVVIPLTRPQRAVDLVQQSGLLGLLAAQGAIPAPTATASGPSVEMHVHSGVADPEQVARRAVRIMERRMGGRGLERVSP